MTKRQSAVTLLVSCGLVIGGTALVVGRFFLSGLPADVHDTVSVSPDGIYTATLHNVNTGAAGSYCQALLRRTDANSKSVVLVDGGYNFMDKVEWGNKDVLTVTTGLESPPDPSWPKSWQGVKIVYKY